MKVSELKTDMDSRFSELKTDIDARFSEFKTEMDARFGKVDDRLEGIETRLDSMTGSATRRKTHAVTSMWSPKISSRR